MISDTYGLLVYRVDTKAATRGEGISAQSHYDDTALSFTC